MKSWRKAVIGTRATIGEAIAAIESGSMQIALVLDASNRLLGVVTDGDIRRGLLRGIALSRTSRRCDEFKARRSVGDPAARGPAPSDAAKVR